MKSHIKLNSIILGTLYLTGCGFSTFTQRETDPFIRDIIGNADKPVAIMVTDSSRRLIYEFNRPGKKDPIYCADAPPDTSIAASGAIGGDVTATIQGGAPNTDGSGSVSAYRITGASTMPLVRRSQGLQYARDMEAKECILFATGITTEKEYKENIKKIREDSKALIEKEIEMGLGQLSVGTPSIPPPPPPPPNTQGKK